VPGNEGAVMFASITSAILIIDDYGSSHYTFKFGFSNNSEYYELFV
jgi:hypothetical protein